MDQNICQARAYRRFFSPQPVRPWSSAHCSQDRVPLSSGLSSGTAGSTARFDTVVIQRDDPEEEIIANTAHFTELIEEYVRRYPNQFFFIGAGGRPPSGRRFTRAKVTTSGRLICEEAHLRSGNGLRSVHEYSLRCSHFPPSAAAQLGRSLMRFGTSRLLDYRSTRRRWIVRVRISLPRLPGARRDVC
jgi:hypothetical protein